MSNRSRQVAMEHNYWLATMDSWDGAVNNEANARLIASAPDLLEALQSCLNWAKNGNQEHLIVFEAAQAAIDKATK